MTDILTIAPDYHQLSEHMVVKTSRLRHKGTHLNFTYTHELQAGSRYFIVTYGWKVAQQQWWAHLQQTGADYRPVKGRGISTALRTWSDSPAQQEQALQHVISHITLYLLSHEPQL